MSVPSSTSRSRYRFQAGERVDGDPVVVDRPAATLHLPVADQGFLRHLEHVQRRATAERR